MKCKSELIIGNTEKKCYNAVFFWSRLEWSVYLPKIIPSRSIRSLDPQGPIPPNITTLDKRNMPGDKQVKQALEGLQLGEV